MKKLFLFVALTAAISFCASTFNSFASSNDSAVTANAPIYWQGWTDWIVGGRIYITVYQSYRQSYYVEVSKYCYTTSTTIVEDDIDNEQYVVKYSDSKKKYYVTFRGRDFYFSM